MKTNFLTSGTIFFHFLQQQSTATSGSSFSFNWNINFSIGPLFRLIETSFLSAENNIVSFRVFFLLVQKLLLKLVESQFLNTNHISASGHQFVHFFERFFKVEAAFLFRGNVFFNKSSIRLDEMQFLSSENCFFDQSYFSASGNHYWN